MAILLIPGKFHAQAWIEAIKGIDPNIEIQVWPEITDPAAIEFAVVWSYPHGSLCEFPNLKCISSLGAGVDHIVSDQQLPKDVPVTRVVDPWLIRDMTQYIIWAVIQFARKLNRYLDQQHRAQWNVLVAPNQINIGIMGMGKLGQDAAEKLLSLGFNVSGWTRTAKTISGVTMFAGQQLDEFLGQIDMLVCLLPLTDTTTGILNKKLFSQLKPGAFLINVARGKHLIEQDLIAALDEGIIAGACLDVFITEPLPAQHPFWHHPKIIVTPHVASVSNPASVAKQLVENYYRAQNNQPLLNRVDVTRGY